MMLGQVDNVDGHYIATQFMFLCVPTGKTMYVTEQESTHTGRSMHTRWSGVEIRFNVKSWLIAYPRVWCWFIAPAIPFFTNYRQNLSDVKASTWAVMGALIVIAIGAHFVGRLPEHEKARLRVLGEVTGMRLDPSKLHQWQREDKRELWDKELKKRGLDTTPAGVSAAASAAPPDTLGILYAFACYSGDGPDWRDTAARIYERIKSSKA